jgi:predicted GNAT family N-acyltransferase
MSFNLFKMQIIRIKPIDTDYLLTTRDIRYKVFVEEQNVPADMEYDEFEDSSHHYLLLENGVGAATCRWRETNNGVKLERFAVLPEHRGKGFGEALVKQLLDDVLPIGKSVYLHSQERVLGFYEKLGFVAEGERFEEAGIQHFKMYFKD